MKLCECGCGQPTKISKQTDKRAKIIKGEYRRFISGHQFKKNIGENHPYWKGGKPNCKTCGKQLTNYGRIYCKKCVPKSGKNSSHYGKFKEKATNWKGGKYHHNGYIMVRDIRSISGYSLEHRIIMEKHIGRPIERWEIVHHKNHIRKDNRIENLELIQHCHNAHVELELKKEIKKLRKILKTHNIEYQSKGRK